MGIRVYASQNSQVVHVHYVGRDRTKRKGQDFDAHDFHFDITVDGETQGVGVPVSRDASYGIGRWLGVSAVLGTTDDEPLNKAAIDLCTARILEAVDQGIDFAQDFEAYPDSFARLFGGELESLLEKRRVPTPVIKGYISRRLHAAWKVGTGKFEDIQRFWRVDESYLRVTTEDLKKVIELYNNDLWRWTTRKDTPGVFVLAQPSLIKELERRQEIGTDKAPVRAEPGHEASGAEAEREYDVALSFAGEDRPYVDEVAGLLKDDGVHIFYDKYEQVDFWGKNLQEHLSDVYQNKARYVVMFVSKDYAAKVWTTLERRSAQARALNQPGRVYILPARFDDTEIPGLLPTVGYIDLRQTTPAQLATMILQKVGER